ncbi:MAG: twin-arginine translocation signal domain-containing protein, partial [Micromonosporaceae bacterium]
MGSHLDRRSPDPRNLDRPSLDRRGLDRRSLLRAAGGIGAAAALGSLTGSGPAHAGPAGFPSYAYIGQPLNKAALRYNPTNEIIFPCIRGVYDRISGGLGRYYLYYAPHDAPGGICLAYGNSLGGPFTEYWANPIISNNWSPYYSVGHVSSPHVLWNPDNRKFYLYFHGENTTTRMAWSYDGIHFNYYGAVLKSSWFPNTSEASYARVFEHQVPGLNNKYVMLFMGNQGGIRRIFWGWSSDAKSWRFDTTPRIWPSDAGESQIS